MNLTEILESAGQFRIAVVGDLIHDRYIDGTIDRISPEAPVPILRITGTRENPGGAGNVVENLKGLGCQVSFFYDSGNTIIKTRVMSGTHHILRMDDEEGPKWMRFDDIDIGLGYGIKNKKFDCVVLSDYNKGMISENVARNVLGMCAEEGVPVVVDAKFNLQQFYDAAIVKCNKKEWENWIEGMAAVTDDAWSYLKPWRNENLVITNGDHGMTYHGYDGDLELSGNIAGHKTDICDACGAGDTVTAVLAIMTALKYPIDTACTLANIAASEVCRHPGVYAINKPALLKRYAEVYADPTSVHSI